MYIKLYIIMNYNRMSIIQNLVIQIINYYYSNTK